MKREGSSHFRPEALQEAEAKDEPPKNPGQNKHRKDDSEAGPQPKKKPRKVTKKTEAGHQEEEPQRKRRPTLLCPGSLAAFFLRYAA